jgi:uncharacterized protein
MLRDLGRFNRLCSELATSDLASNPVNKTLGEFLKYHGFSTQFRDWYLLPMVACIWSCPPRQMLAFPMETMIRFCHNHGLLQIANRPQWFTVKGGSRHYVEKITARIPDKRLGERVLSIQRGDNKDIANKVCLTTQTGSEFFDKLIIATHPDQALAMLQQPSPAELNTLSAIRYQSNQAVLHTDTSVLPSRTKAWAAWNYERDTQEGSVCLHYLINRLQPLPWAQPVIVSLNPLRAIPEVSTLGIFNYDHPVFDQVAIAAQSELNSLQGQLDTYYCGAWTGYGFHEDGLKSGMAAAKLLISGVVQ